MNILDTIRDFVRGYIKKIAKLLNKLSGGKLSPNTVTIIGVSMHVPIATLIALGSYNLAALLLIFFGLFDALDGELARLQKKASSGGMLLDASTDRLKEVFLYSGAAYAFAATGRPFMTVWAVLACGLSLLVSYVKAKGETAVVGEGLTPNEINRLFQDGFARFEVRMAMLVVGLLLNQLVLVVVVIALLSGYTAIKRLINITARL